MSSERLATALATWFGCGKSKIAPGTVGTIGALPLHVLLSALGPVPYLAAIAGITAAGTWAAQREAERLGVEDPQSVVVDEVAGVLIALFMTLGRTRRARVMAVILFRVFDIWKPGPIDSIQHMKPEGVGIMVDDVAAGVLAGLVARLIG
jgi:phosphatidylglycerophosphatase A